jgi:chemotaxis protein MotB
VGRTEMKAKRRQDTGSEKTGGGWEIIYTGFILILLCFFIMLSSFATMEAAKVTKFIKSFSKALSVMSGGLSIDPGPDVLNPSREMVDPSEAVSQLLEEVKGFAREVGLEDDISMITDERGVVMRFSDTTIYPVGSADIEREALPFLRKIGLLLSRTTNKIRIEGHTDNLPIQTWRYPSNWELSTGRAVSVLRYLIDSGLVEEDRMSAEGFGEFHPLYDNDTPENRARNRRVEIIVVK